MGKDRMSVVMGRNQKNKTVIAMQKVLKIYLHSKELQNSMAKQSTLNFDLFFLQDISATVSSV